MVDVSAKPIMQREAIASGSIRLQRSTIKLIQSQTIAKGNVLGAARLAGIMAAKQTSQLIPLCHPLPMTHIDLQFTIDSTQGVIYIEATTRTTYKTGVDVEALAAATIAALTIYDMCKGVIQLLHLNRLMSLVKAEEKAGRSNLNPKPVGNKN